MIAAGDAFDAVYQKMVSYLAKADMSERRLVDRIMRLRARYPHNSRYRGFTRECAWQAIEQLRSNGFIDEERFARSVYTGLANRSNGPRLIRQKMMRRQIASAVIERVLADATSAPKDFETIIRRTQHKVTTMRIPQVPARQRDYAIRHRLYSWLQSRGYTHDECMMIVRRALRQ